ncbi:WD40/YVTN/BNR-like repeat-containing protein [Dokdonella sp.]|uniref:WD40/YVTN/BNR-like repeat-containing protein n=1 Tax=Dokdonella sp. TaxID=2291710 RepID=UPI00352787E4
MHAFPLKPLAVKTCFATLFVMISGLPAIAAVGSWSSAGPYGGSNYSLSVYEPGPSTLIATGRGGIFRSLSSGTSWQRIEVGLPEAVYAQGIAVGTSAPVLYLSSFYQLFRSGNGGDLWVPLSTPLPPDNYIYDVSLRRGTSNSIAIATSLGAYVSTNGGSTWIGPGAGGTTVQFSKIVFAADGSLYMGVQYADASAFGGATLLKSTDGGASWAPLANQPPGLFGVSVLVVSPVDPQRIHVGDGSSAATSSNGGASWSALSLPSAGAGCGNFRAMAAHPADAQALFVACSNNGVHFTADVSAPGWISWTAANGLSVNGTDPVQAGALAIHPGYPGTATLWAGTVDGGLFRTTNGGTNWSTINNGYESVNIRALATHPVDTNPAGAVVLAGLGDSFTTTNAIYKSSNGGSAWAPSLTGLNAEQIRSIAIDPTTVDNDILTAENFTVYAAGRSERIPTNANKDGGIYKSTDAGNTWTTIDNGIALIAGQPDMGTVRSIAPDPRSCAAPPASGPCPIGSGPLQTLFAAGGGRPNLSAPGLPYNSARIYKSTNAGGLWTPSETGLPLPQDLGPTGAFNYAWMGGIVPLVFDPTDTQTIYIGSFLSWDSTASGASEPTLPNGVFKSTDGGASWVHSSNGLPHVLSPASSHYDVLALAINPVNPQILYAGVINFYAPTTIGRIYKSVDGGANWSESSTGIAGQDVRALFIDPMDPTGDTVYAGTGGDGANPGGVYVTTNGGASWNSISIGLPADSATSLAMPARAPGAPARVLIGTNAGVWDYTAAADPDLDGSPSAVENGVLAGDGNDDGIPDANQTSVASISAPGSLADPGTQASNGSIVQTTIEIVPVSGGCSQLNDSASLQADLYPPDPAGAPDSHSPWGLVSFSLPNCSLAKVRVTFHGANFDSNWKWRNYGPRIPGDATTFGWYSFAGAQRIDAETWELTVDAALQGNYRNDPNDILFVGGPGNLPDTVFENGFE